MNVHSATCSCSIELYKQWYTLADFSQTGIFCGVFSNYHFFRWTYQRSCNSRRPYIFLPRWSSGRLHWGPYFDFSRDFSVHDSPGGTCEAEMGGAWLGGGEAGHYIFSLEGCDGWDGGWEYYFDHGGKIYAPGGPTSGLKGSILFLGEE